MSTNLARSLSTRDHRARARADRDGAGPAQPARVVTRQPAHRLCRARRHRRGRPGGVEPHRRRQRRRQGDAHSDRAGLRPGVVAEQHEARLHRLSLAVRRDGRPRRRQRRRKRGAHAHVDAGGRVAAGLVAEREADRRRARHWVRERAPGRAHRGRRRACPCTPARLRGARPRLAAAGAAAQVPAPGLFETGAAVEATVRARRLSR